MTPIMHLIMATPRGVALPRGQFLLLRGIGLDPLLEASMIKLLVSFAVSPECVSVEIRMRNTNSWVGPGS